MLCEMSMHLGPDSEPSALLPLSQILGCVCLSSDQLLCECCHVMHAVAAAVVVVATE